MTMASRYLRALRPTLATTLFALCAPAHAQVGINDAFDPEGPAQLRCWYKLSPDTTDMGTSYVDAEGTELRGKWRAVSAFRVGAMFFTLQEPEDIIDACRRTLAARQLGPLVQASAASTRAGKNFPVWYDGDIASRRGRPVERMVAFGDSLSDTGNIYNESLQTLPIHTSWFLGRFSNGPVWTEYLAHRSGLSLTTWALGGSQTDQAHGVIASLGDQVDSFIRYSRAGINRYDPSRTVFTVMIGGNDFINAGRSADTVAAEVESALGTLIDFGARKIMLVGLPDLTRAPTFRQLDGSDEGRDDAETVFEKVRQFNAALPGIASRLSQFPDVQVRWVDTATPFAGVMADPASADFSEVAQACLDIRTRAPSTYLTTQRVRAGCDPDRYVFWDLIHPTTRAHALIASWVYDALPREWDLGN
jgi:thermolabile hemolysin